MKWKNRKPCIHWQKTGHYFECELKKVCCGDRLNNPCAKYNDENTK